MHTGEGKVGLTLHVLSATLKGYKSEVRGGINHKNGGLHTCPGSKMTISGRPEIGLEDVPWALAAHRIDVLRTSVDPKMVQIREMENLYPLYKTIFACKIWISVLLKLTEKTILNLQKFALMTNDYLLTPSIHFLKTFFYYLMRPFSDQRTSSGRPYNELPTSRGRSQDQFTDHHLTISDVLRTSVCCLGVAWPLHLQRPSCRVLAFAQQKAILCIRRESNPGHRRGRWAFYHWCRCGPCSRFLTWPWPHSCIANKKREQPS